VAVGRMLMKNADNLLMVGMILGGPEDDAVLGGEAQLESTVVDDGFKMTQTVMNHVDDLRQTTREVGGVTRFFKGEPLRPYLNSPGTNLLVKTIMEGDAMPDPRSVATALAWKVPGFFNGSEGFWELVVEMESNTILHFNFVR